MNRETLIEDAVSNYWNVKNEYKGKSLPELRNICETDTLPFAVCAINITGDLNLGVMIRTACLLGAERFIVYGRHGYDRRSTVGAQNYIEIVKAGSIDRGGSLEVDYSEFFPTLNSFGYHPVFFETGGRPLREFNPNVCVEPGKLPCLVFGNEGVGIEPSLMEGKTIFSLHQRGVLRSFNVCAAASIAIEHVSHYYRDKWDAERIMSPSSSPA